MMKYRFRASVLDQPDKSDPDNELFVIGVKVQEVSLVPRKTVFEPIEETPEGSTQVIRQVREDGLEDLAWGCKVQVPRKGEEPALIRAIAALAVSLLKDPPPAFVMDAIREAYVMPGEGSMWSGWIDLPKGVPPLDKPVI
jgi:hypothetical protein